VLSSACYGLLSCILRAAAPDYSHCCTATTTPNTHYSLLTPLQAKVKLQVLTGIKQRAAAAPLATAAAALSPAAVAALEAAAAAGAQLDAARSQLLALLTAARLPCARRLAYALAVATAALDAAQHREAAAEDSAARAALAAAEAAEEQQQLAAAAAAAAAAAQSDAPLQEGDSPEELDEEAQLVKALLSKRSERRGELRRLQLDLRAQRMSAVRVQAKREQVLLLLLMPTPHFKSNPLLFYYR
jgi:hypothetical protein